MFSRLLFIFSISVFLSLSITAQLRLPSVIGDGMVLQQNDSCAIWGWAAPGDKVFVTTSWDNHTDSTRTTNMATWKLKVKTPVAGGPYSITIKNRSTITLSDIMIGEVWVCSGQSNMEWSFYNGAKDIAPEFPTAYNKNIRFFHVDKTASYYPQDDLKAKWESCDSNTLKRFSAVGYFFGKKLQQQLNVPIGLINASWGGTPAETWTPAEKISENEKLKTAAAKLQTFAWWPAVPGQAYNGMIAPLISYNIAGAIWYQGEANTGTNDTYTELLTTMIDSWRGAWKKTIPFYYVQIAPFKYGPGNTGALLQEAQTKAMSHPGTGMVVITDLIDSVANIHPSYKHEVGNRLAGWALAETYKKQGLVYKSPQFKSIEKQGNKLIITVDNAPNGLTATNKVIAGFFIAGADQKWLPAEVKIEKDKIQVWNKSLKDPMHVRYGFGNTIVGNVSGKEGLPLVPFRTDAWPADPDMVK